MKTIQGGHFTVEYSEPHTIAGSQHTYTRNGSLSVVCATAERAAELLRWHSPDATIHVIRRAGSTKTVLIDDEL